MHVTRQVSTKTRLHVCKKMRICKLATFRDASLETHTADIHEEANSCRKNYLKGGDSNGIAKSQSVASKEAEMYQCYSVQKHQSPRQYLGMGGSTPLDEIQNYKENLL